MSAPSAPRDPLALGVTSRAVPAATRSASPIATSSQNFTGKRKAVRPGRVKTSRSSGLRPAVTRTSPRPTDPQPQAVARSRGLPAAAARANASRPGYNVKRSDRRRPAVAQSPLLSGRPKNGQSNEGAPRVPLPTRWRHCSPSDRETTGRCGRIRRSYAAISVPQAACRGEPLPRQGAAEAHRTPAARLTCAGGHHGVAAEHEQGPQQGCGHRRGGGRLVAAPRHAATGLALAALATICRIELRDHPAGSRRPPPPTRGLARSPGASQPVHRGRQQPVQPEVRVERPEVEPTANSRLVG
jgi:hypothetical protein